MGQIQHMVKAKLSGMVAAAVLCVAMPAVAGETVVGDVGELQVALKRAVAGDVVVMKAGEWKDCQVVVEARGTSEKPVVVRAEKGGGVVLSGKSSVKIGGAFVVVDGLSFKGFEDAEHIVSFKAKGEATDCRLTNCSIEGDDKSSDDMSSFWVSMYGERNRVDHCYFKGKKTVSPTLTVWVSEKGLANGHRIDHNDFAGRPKLATKDNGGETMRIGTSGVSMTVSKTIVEDNLFEHCDGEAEVVSNKSCENIIRHNTFIECKGGLSLRHGNRNLVEGNVFYGNHVAGTGGVRVIGEDQTVVGNRMYNLGGKGFFSGVAIMAGIKNSPANGYFQVKNAVVKDNVIVDCAESVTIGVGFGERNRTESPEGVRFEGNTIYSSAGPLVRVLGTPKDVVWMGNRFGGAAVGVDAEDENTTLEKGPEVPAVVRPAEVGPGWRK